VGRDALRAARHAPDRFEPHPKLRLGEHEVLLGGVEHRDVELVAAVFARVAAEAQRVAGNLPPAVLTCPAVWGSVRRSALVAAAEAAGLRVESLIEEPVAAAAFFAEVLRRSLPPGRPLAVFDLGGGTLDVALVRPGPDGPAVVALTGRDDLGGRDIDAAVLAHLRGGDTGHADPAMWAEARAAKETLSRASVAPVQVTPDGPVAHLTRTELEDLARPLVAAASEATAAMLRAHGVRPAELAGVFLVGGATRMPLVAHLLHRDLGVAPTTLEQPETAVAEGAAVLARRAVAGPRPPTGRVPQAAPAAPTAAGAPAPVQRPRRRAWALGAGATLVAAATAAVLVTVLPEQDRDTPGGTGTTPAAPIGAGASPAGFNVVVANWPETTVHLLADAQTDCLTGEVRFSQGRATRDNGQWLWRLPAAAEALTSDYDGDGAVDAALRVECGPYGSEPTEKVWIISGSTGSPRMIGFVDLDGAQVKQWTADGPRLTIVAQDALLLGPPLWTRTFEMGDGTEMKPVTGGT
jgi:Ethanolamine utilization protein EutJ (predicted chaperonin)